MGIQFKQLGPQDLSLMNSLLDCFGNAFEQRDVYGNQRPAADYLARLLDGESFIAMVALENRTLVGGLAAYELRKFEQRRSEIYIYDLAVAAPHRRRGIATGLIEALKSVAQQRRAGVIFVQADCDDEPAIRCYSKLGVREEVLHFDIPVIEQAGNA